MREIGRAPARLAASWRSDAMLGGLTVACMLGYQQAGGVRWAQRVPAIGFGLALAATLPLRRRHPVAAGSAFGVILLALSAAQLPHAAAASLQFFAWMPFFLAYSGGAMADLIAGLAATTWLAAALLALARYLNPFFIMITAGPWLAGRVVRSRRDVIAQLEARNAELAAERHRFARESVRCERARIARELHDIVAHNLSVVVIQAAAGQRFCGTDQRAAAESLAAIAEAAESAQAETGRVVGLLDNHPPRRALPAWPSVDELVRRARAAGQQVTCKAPAAGGQLPPAASRAAYRAVQEALTNAMRHAPGASVVVTASESGGSFSVDIENGPPPGGMPGPNWQGTGRGLDGLKDRVAACGGSFTAGPTCSGGWLVRAQLPAAPPTAAWRLPATGRRLRSAASPGKEEAQMSEGNSGSDTTSRRGQHVSGASSTGRRGLALAVYRWGLLVFLAAGVVQIFLAGLGTFRLLHGAGNSAFDPHRMLGFAMAGIAISVLILALAARPGARAIAGAALLVLLTSFVQSLLAGLADDHVIFGALHAVDGLLILAIPAYLYAWSRRQPG
jgi:signal transduction histidine kinase